VLLGKVASPAILAAGYEKQVVSRMRPVMESTQISQQQRILVFDVNGTLRDMKALAPSFKRMFGDSAVLKEWFAELLLYSQTVTLTGNYVDFGTLARSALESIARIRGTQLAEEDVSTAMRSIRALHPYPEVPAALRLLRERGFRLVTLTNSSQEAAKAQIRFAGLDGIFKRIFSVDAVRMYVSVTLWPS